MVALKGGNKSLFAIRVHEFTAGRAGQRQEKLITEVIGSTQQSAFSNQQSAKQKATQRSSQ